MINYSQVPSPCYVLEESRLIRNLEILSRVEKEADVKIICALKGYSMWSTFPLVGKYLAGATASSLNEAKLARNEMNREVHVFAPVYGDDEIDEILSLADHITFNSFSQWKRFKEKTQAAHVSAGIRVNPEFSTVETDLYNPCGKYSRLGVTLKEFKPEELDGIEGLHFHALCEQNADALAAVLKNFEERFGKWIPQMKWVNFGGVISGFLCMYFFDNSIWEKLRGEFQEKRKHKPTGSPDDPLEGEVSFLDSQKQLDAILKKVSATGVNSLTESEKSFLIRESKRRGGRFGGFRN